MGDLLSASSLLMAITAILFSLWYAEIAKALEIAPKKHREDNIRELSTVRAVLYAKAIPITLTALLVALIFLPDTIKLFLESFDFYRTVGLATLNRLLKYLPQWLSDDELLLSCTLAGIGLV